MFTGEYFYGVYGKEIELGVWGSKGKGLKIKLITYLIVS